MYSGINNHISAFVGNISSNFTAKFKAALQIQNSALAYGPFAHS